MTQELSLQKHEADAYSKGWASTAKDADKAVVIASKKYGEGSPLVNLFLDGYKDKRGGAPKWDSVNAAKLEAAAEAAAPTQVSVDGVTVAMTTHVNLDDDLAYEAAHDAGDMPEHEHSIVSETTTNEVSIRGLLDSITKDTPAAERKEIRELVNTRKNHYKMGYNSATSPIFSGFKDAREGYLKRRPNSPYIADWEEGYAQAEAGLPFGAIWQK